MTVTPSSPAPRARRPRTRAAVVALTIALALGAGVPTAAAGSVPADATPSPSPTATVPGEAVFTLAPIGSGILAAGQSLTVSVTLQNDTDAGIGPGSVSLAFGHRALTSRSALASWLAGDTTAVTTDEVAIAALPAVPARDEQTEGVMVAADAPALQNLAAGVYPVVATLTTPQRTFVSTSAVIVPDPGAAPVGIGLVVPITADATADGLLTADQLAALTAPAGSLTNVLDAVAGTDAILAIDPAIPAAIRVLGVSAPASALDWLTRLEELDNSRFALQFGDADVTVQVQAGIPSPLQPTSLQAYMTPADFPVDEDAPAPSPSPSPTEAPDGPDYPDLPTLLDIGGARAGVFWPATDTADAGVVEALGALTVDGQRGLVLVDSEHTVAGSDGDTVPARGDANGKGVLTYDSAVSRELQAASLQDESVIRAAHLTAATAYLAFATRETGGAPLLVSIVRGADRSRVSLRTAVTTALGAPGTTPLTLGGVANSRVTPVEISDAPADESRVQAASVLVSDEATLGRFTTVLDDPAVLTGPERAEILQLLGLGWLPTPDAWHTAITAHREATAAILESVGVVPPIPIQLISSGAGIPVWVRNDLPYPVNVVIVAAPDDLRLEVQERTSVIAQARSNTRVEIPVQAQIGNGDVGIGLALVSPAGVPIGEPQTVEVHVRADWEGIGLVILGVLVVGLVGLGLVRTILRRRAARRVDAEAPEAPEAPESPHGDAPDPDDTATPDDVPTQDDAP